MITINLCGGLGNQLFQIYGLISYCIDNDNLFILEKIDSSPSVCGNRVVYWDNFFSKIARNCRTIKMNFPIWQETGFKYDKIPVFDKSQHVKIIGYLQSYKYFENNFDKINELIGIDEKLNLVKKKRGLNFDNKVSLHFRVGDYVNLSDAHPLMPLKYYENALLELIKRTDKDDWDVIYYYEANDVEYVTDKINKLKSEFVNMTFTGCDVNMKDWEQMLEMACCKHNIIANSSFSWWGAYFNVNDEREVFYPSRWFGDKLKQHDVSDLFKKEWIKIDIIYNTYKK